ncbi:MAG: hypothetical protein Hals2KO_07080 [Halioglobus sp.]
MSVLPGVLLSGVMHEPPLVRIMEAERQTREGSGIAGQPCVKPSASLLQLSGWYRAHSVG